MIKKIVILLLISMNTYAIDIDTSMTGSWFDQGNPGQGINVEILSGNRILVYWYAYDQGNPLWLTGVGTYQGEKAEIELSQFDGSNFGTDHDQNLVVSSVFGSLSITFDTCTAGTMTYASVQGLGNGSININRLTEIPGLPCGATTTPTPTTPFSQNIIDTNGLRITPMTCSLLSDTLTCEFSVTSLEEDADVSLTIGSKVNINGIVHDSDRVTLGTDTGGFASSRANASLTKGIPVIGNIRIDGIPSSTQILTLLKLSFEKDRVSFDIDYFDAIVVNQN